jgi:hypothetical protein
MPFLIAPLVIGALGAELAGTAIIGSLTVGGLVSGALSTGLMFGLSQLLNQQPKGAQQRSQVTAKDANPRRLRGYGYMKLGGPVFFLKAVNGAYLYTGIIHCEGEIDGYEQWWADDIQIAIPGPMGGTNATAPWTNHLHVYSTLGTPNQAASAVLTGNFPGIWTEDHRGAGLAYSVMVCVLPAKASKTFQKVFPSGGAPTLRVVARLSKVHDPYNAVPSNWNNPATWYWSRNPALCIMDFLTIERTDAVSGRKWSFLPKSRINLASFGQFRNLCNEGVPITTGGNEERYNLNGIYDLSEEPRDVLRRMLSTCDAELVPFPDGSVGIKGGKWEEPTVTLIDEHIQSFRYEQGNDKLSAFNRLKWTFTDPLNDYQQIEGDPWDDNEAQIEAGEILNGNLDLPMVQSHSQGRRLAKIYTAKMNPQHKLTNVVCKMPALALVGERVVRVRLSYLDLDEVFIITRFEPSLDLMTATVDLSSIDPSAYAWSPVSEEGQRPAIASSTAPTTTPPVATGVVLSIVSTEIATGVFANAIRAAANPPTVDDFSQYWTLRGRFRVPGGSEWSDMVSDNGSASAVISTQPLTVGETYEVQVSYGGLNQEGTWVNGGTIVATA